MFGFQLRFGVIHRGCILLLGTLLIPLARILLLISLLAALVRIWLGIPPLQSVIDERHHLIARFPVQFFPLQARTYHVQRLVASGIAPVDGIFQLETQISHILLGPDILLMLHLGRPAVGGQSQHIPGDRQTVAHHAGHIALLLIVFLACGQLADGIAGADIIGSISNPTAGIGSVGYMIPG